MLSRTLLIAAFALCLALPAGARTGLTHPGEDFFWTHPREEAGKRINAVYREAEARLELEQRALDQERARRAATARTAPERKELADWYLASARKITEKRDEEFRRRESARHRMNAFYADQKIRSGHNDLAVRAAYRRERDRKLKAIAERDRAAQSPPVPTPAAVIAPRPEPPKPEPKDERLRLWNAEVARHQGVEARLVEALSAELRLHLRNRERWQNHPEQTAEEDRRHAAVQSKLRALWDAEARRFADSWAGFGPG